ncbi:hypothetical protein [Piscinibacter sakaiensis]|uniref:hypothetical protein n=1 Tax=Piscinibacter sakaiensis TaxID=1547922 RepID=UPI003AB02BBF
MHKSSRLMLLLACAALTSQVALAKLPPLSEEAQAKAAEAAAKAAWSSKVAAYQLCVAQDRVASTYRAKRMMAGAEVKPPVETPPCTDPGPFAAAPNLEKAGAHSAPGPTPAAPAAASASAPKS